MDELHAGDSTDAAVKLLLSYTGAMLDLSDLVLEFTGEVLPLADATVDSTGKVFTWSQVWVAANARSLDADNFAATLPVGAKVPVCLRGGAPQMCPQAPAVGNGTGNTDAALRSLALGDASNNSAIAIEPAFDPAITSYTASVLPGVDLVSLRVSYRGNAAIAYLDEKRHGDPG